MVTATATLSDLAPNATYHFRIVATSESGTVYGKDTSFSTLPQGLLGLPDGRRYEMVSPLKNSDGNVYETSVSEANADPGAADETLKPFQAAANGDAMTYVGDPSEKGGSGSEGNGGGNQYLASRAPQGGWTASNISPPSASIVEEPVYQGFSSDLSVGVFDYNGLAPLTNETFGEGFNVLYTHSSIDGSDHPLLTDKPADRGKEEFQSYGVPHLGERAFEASLAYSGGNGGTSTVPAYSHLLFAANDALPVGGQPQPEDGGETQNNLYESVNGKLQLVNVLPNGTTSPNAMFGSASAPDFSNVISNDGSHVIWTDLSSAASTFARTLRKPCPCLMVLLLFLTATPDGHYVFYQEGEELWRFDAENATRLEIAEVGAEVQGVLGASEDGAYLYFVANGALAAGAQKAGVGPNLYLFHEGEPLKFIVELASRDNEMFPFNLEDGDSVARVGNRTSQVTPDGLNLLFESVRNLTGYVETGRTEVLPEIFLYSARSDRIVCVSCNPSGAPEPSTAGRYFATFLPPSGSNTYAKRWMSADGTRVLFDTFEALVPQDTNGKLDVYEWEQEGVAGCSESTSARAVGGCLFLLSGGTSTDGSFFADASSNGDDAFIITRAHLVPQDENEVFDVYDARVGAARSPSPPACSGSGCQGVPPAPPVFATPSSETFSGVGNFESAPPSAVKPKSLARAQELADALRACRSKRNKGKRQSCEAAAKKRYRAKAKVKKSTGRGK